MKQSLLLLLPLILTTQLFANDSTAYKWQWEGVRAILVSFTPSLSSDIKNDEGSTTFSLADAFLIAPIYKKNNTFFGGGFFWKATAPELYGYSADSISLSPRIAHSGQIVAAFARKFNEKWSLYTEYNGGPNGIWSEPRKSWTQLAFGYATFKPKANRYFRFGAALATLWGKPQVYPVIGAAIGFTDLFAIDFLLPKHLLFRFRLSPKIETGARFAYLQSNAGFVEETRDILIDYAFNQWSGSAYFDYRIYKNIIARIELGQYIARNIKFLDIESDKVYYEATPAETPYLSFHVRLQV